MTEKDFWAVVRTVLVEIVISLAVLFAGALIAGFSLVPGLLIGEALHLPVLFAGALIAVAAIFMALVLSVMYTFGAVLSVALYKELLLASGDTKGSFLSTLLTFIVVAMIFAALAFLTILIPASKESAQPKGSINGFESRAA